MMPTDRSSAGIMRKGGKYAAAGTGYLFFLIFAATLSTPESEERLFGCFFTLSYFEFRIQTSTLCDQKGIHCAYPVPIRVLQKSMLAKLFL